MHNGLNSTKIIRGVFHLDISFHCWFRGIKVPYCVLWKSLQFLPGKLKDQISFIAEEVDGAGDMGLGDSTMVNAETHLKVFFWM